MSGIKKIIKNMLPYGVVKKYESNHNEILHYEPVAQRELYNVQGERVYTYFLKDDLCVHQPWGLVYGRTPKRVLWDRMHPGLDVHFYTSSDILKTIGTPRKKFAYLLESEEIVPEDYSIFNKYVGIDKEFDLIFTFSDRLLNKFSNARFLPASGVWYGNEYSGTKWDEKCYEKKTKNISMIASNKLLCQLHKLRQSVAYELKQRGLADTYGSFDGGSRVTYIDETLRDYRFQVVIENEVSDYYFTEKILNCFASMTIPIYIGAKKIGEFFNIDGIIEVKEQTIEAIINAIKQCTEEYYDERIDSIKDNFYRVKKYLCVEDYLIDHYESELL